MSRAMRKCLVSYANNKGADQPAHPRSLISAFVVRCLDSIISLDYIAEISRLQLASVAAQASLSLTWSETPEDTFCHVEAHVCFHLYKKTARDPAYMVTGLLSFMLLQNANMTE